HATTDTVQAVESQSPMIATEDTPLNRTVEEIVPVNNTATNEVQAVMHDDHTLVIQPSVQETSEPVTADVQDTMTITVVSNSAVHDEQASTATIEPSTDDTVVDSFE